ncbi:MAG TPA: hypothetical protein VMF30_02470 [Pirellulales bacterium]|nr:hypothetical protein [Pirellulales bacterium]
MSVDALKHLAEETLYGSRMHHDGSCFTWNLAGQELREAPPAVLPVIESLIIQQIVPALDLPQDADHADRQQRLLQILGPKYAESLGDATNDRFPGLTEFFAAYWTVGSRAGAAERTIGFVRGLPPRLVRQAIAAVNVAFGNPATRDQIPAELGAFLSDVATSGAEPLQTFAEKCLELLQRAKDRRKR